MAISAGGVMKSTGFDPARVLGCSVEEARQLMSGRVVTPGEVEGVALQSYRWRAHLRDPESYWITVGQAAAIVGVSGAELRRLLDDRRLPFYTHRSGVRLMRRQQIQDIARHRTHAEAVGRRSRDPVGGAGRLRYARSR